MTKYHYVLRVDSAATSRATGRKLDDAIKVADAIACLADTDPLIAKYGRKKRLNMCINMYTQTMLTENAEIAGRKSEMRSRVKAHLGDAPLLGVKGRAMAWAIVYWPAAYRAARVVYDHAKHTGDKYKVE